MLRIAEGVRAVSLFARDSANVIRLGAEPDFRRANQARVDRSLMLPLLLKFKAFAYHGTRMLNVSVLTSHLLYLSVPSRT
jgi:hypothetical protein